MTDMIPRAEADVLVAAAMRPRVKPLVWELRDLWFAYAPVANLEYSISEDGGFYWLNDPQMPFFKTLEAAKAAAQADYERRVMEALEPTPDDARAALEAMLAEAEKRGEKRGMLRAAEIVLERWAGTNAELEDALRAEAEE